MLKELLTDITKRADILKDNLFHEKGHREVTIAKLAALNLLYLELHQPNITLLQIERALLKAIGYNEAATSGRAATKGSTGALLHRYAIERFSQREIEDHNRNTHQRPKVRLTEHETQASQNALIPKLQKRQRELDYSTKPVALRKKNAVELAILRLRALEDRALSLHNVRDRGEKTPIHLILEELEQMNIAAVAGTLKGEGKTGALIKEYLNDTTLTIFRLEHPTRPAIEDALPANSPTDWSQSGAGAGAGSSRRPSHHTTPTGGGGSAGALDSTSRSKTPYPARPRAEASSGSSSRSSSSGRRTKSRRPVKTPPTLVETSLLEDQISSRITEFHSLLKEPHTFGQKLENFLCVFFPELAGDLRALLSIPEEIVQRGGAPLFRRDATYAFCGFAHPLRTLAAHLVSHDPDMMDKDSEIHRNVQAFLSRIRNPDSSTYSLADHSVASDASLAETYEQLMKKDGTPASAELEGLALAKFLNFKLSVNNTLLFTDSRSSPVVILSREDTDFPEHYYAFKYTERNGNSLFAAFGQCLADIYVRRCLAIKDGRHLQRSVYYSNLRLVAKTRLPAPTMPDTTTSVGAGGAARTVFYHNKATEHSSSDHSTGTSYS
jgi:hypothetical protein